MKRYGKSSGALFRHKQDFFQANESIHTEITAIGDVYIRQPLRLKCKNCNHDLTGERFTKKAIEYIQCSVCGHLNGAYEDTDEFCRRLYTEYNGEGYARNYSAADEDAYRNRLRDIYVPKAEFLRDALVDLDADPSEMRIVDFGAGSGYFVGALRETGFRQTHGLEVSRSQVALADAMLGQGAVLQHALEDTPRLAAEADADILSMIGVLEHLQQPRPVLDAMAGNPKIRFFYMSVPLFSPTVSLEAVFPGVFQRQLSAGHTHLYTESSLDHMATEFGMRRVAEWWFGTDMVDLFRSVSVELDRHVETSALTGHWQAAMREVIDEAQLALDKRRLSSEVHMLFAFDR